MNTFYMLYYIWLGKYNKYENIENKLKSCTEFAEYLLEINKKKTVILT